MTSMGVEQRLILLGEGPSSAQQRTNESVAMMGK
jgi:hypothetical protein